MGNQFYEKKQTFKKETNQKIKKLIKDNLDDAEKYFTKIREILMHKGEENVLFINFDEVNLPFDLSCNFPIEEQGENQVPILTHNKAKIFCIIYTGVTSDGQIILQLIIFKYKSTGKKKREAPTKYQIWVNLTHPVCQSFVSQVFPIIQL